ncbi:MAG: D-alanine--D-alanine ligase [Deltaproteobacteria bacterium]|nr:D-alanine--D-alanine ligase [Deltaproteobacteria bacterium]
MGRRRVGVLFGGLSAEREVSLETGEACAQALERLGHDVVRLLVDADIDQLLRRARLDAAFLALHGRYGEDGCIQGLLELLGIPYTGSGVLASALAMDKLKSKEIFRLHNIATPPYYALGAADAARCVALHGSFGFPAVVKPRREGSSVGVSVVHETAELSEAVREALRFDDEVLVERFVRGKEVCVGLLDGRVLGAIEVAPKGEFYDYRSKYAPGESEYHFPARLSPTRYRGVLALAERANRALGCTGASRVDLLVTDGENEYALEVNSLPGMTPTSLLPKIAAGAGYDYDKLVKAILAGARLHAGGGARTTARTAEQAPAKAAVPARRRAAGGRGAR